MSPPDTTSNDSGGHKLHFPRFVVGLFLIVIAAGLFFFSNQHGRNAWENYKTELEARGEKLDWRDWLPPAPPPDEENFAATPLLKAIGVLGKTDPIVEGRFKRLSIYHALGNTGDFEKGERTDLVAVQKLLREQTNNGLSWPPLPQSPAADVLAALKPVEADLNELRDAAIRPYAQIKLSLGDPTAMDTPNFVSLRELAQIFDLKAIAELRLGNADDAFSDARVIFRLADSVKSSPTLVSAMICVAIDGLAPQPYWEGWVTGQWSDRQLEGFQELFAKTDLLSVYDTHLRGGERAFFNYQMDHLTRQQHASTLRLGDRDWRSIIAFLDMRFGNFVQRNQLTYNRLLDEVVLSNHSLVEQRVFPGKWEKNSVRLEDTVKRATFLSSLPAIAFPYFMRAVQSVAHNQTYINMALVTCALERYRRANGQYPDSLGALTPEFAKALPHDLITGQPLKYRRTDDGSFLLYSVGWNEKDDDGLKDKDKGDWVWPVRAKK